MRDIQRRITTIFDYTYTSSAIRVPSAACVEVGKLLHVGMFLEEVKGRRPAFNLSPKERKQLDGSPGAFAKETAKWIRHSYAEMNDQWQLYKDRIRFNDQDIGFIVGELSGLDISDTNHDVFGDALEIFRSKWAKQEGGQFFTDQLVTHLAVRLLEFDPTKGDDLVDICSGTGGFLLAGLNRIKEIADSKGLREDAVASLAAKALKGLEIDQQVATLGNATLLARTGQLATTIIGTANSLDLTAITRASTGIKLDAHLCIATNPPFGAKTPVRDRALLAQYELAAVNGSSEENLIHTTNRFFSRSPDVLFLEANLRLLKPGKGRMAIVTPYQVLSGPQAYYVRDWLLKHCHIEAVVDLPAETFQPHTGTKTSLLVVRRRKRKLNHARSDNGGRVFMSIPRWIGHDRRGKTVFAKTPDGATSEHKLTDIPDVVTAYFHFKNGAPPSDVHADSFDIDYATIVHDPMLRLNALSYKPHVLTHGGNDLPEGWHAVRLGDVVSRVFYPGRFKREYVDRYPQAVPFLGGSNISEVIAHTGKWMRHDDRRIPDLAVKEGWILITRSGTTGIVSFAPKAWDGFAISEHVIRIIPDPTKLDPYFLLAYLKSSRCQADIKRGVFGSVIDEISPESIANLMIAVPRAGDVKRIAALARCAEEARNSAISNSHQSVVELESLF